MPAENFIASRNKATDNRMTETKTNVPTEGIILLQLRHKKNLQQLPERLVPLGLIEGPPQTAQYHTAVMFKGAINVPP